MLFNSLHFLFFFPVVLILNHLLKGKIQRIFLLGASFYFYMSWRKEFILLLLYSIVIDYFASLKISGSPQGSKARKVWLVLSLVTNLGLLAYFKYTNFLLGVVNDLTPIAGFKFAYYDIILPVGISFYTFQSMSYTIDVYRGQIEAKKSFLDFALYVSFFPQLVAGPIVRAQTFFRDLDMPLPVNKEDIQIAFCQILIGFTRKIVFADNLAKVVDFTFKNHATLNPIEIWTGALAFGWQIYFDFAGYTDIAIGVARLFGYKFDPNFNFPMVARNITDHWSRWHISFSTWIRDYIFIPLGGSRGSVFLTYRNIFITWFFAGVWHGAAYHYIGWGLWQGIMILVNREYGRTKVAAFLNEKGGRIYDIAARVFTMFCLTFGFIMFRAETMEKAIPMMKALVFWVPGGFSSVKGYTNYTYGLLLIVCFAASYLFAKNNIEKIVESRWKFILFFLANVFMLLIFGITESQSFLYFAF
ncbi:MBOAT family protein [Leptospira sp. 201903070]|uniref:MBOAT family protein n=1 Tax=Leptospira ainlahdjerensis TaxID=2810033 RepID=A0ABS2UB64_9LEPT|nr:MBOAT family protein [Leptospira ainlahdjerensis]MBM9576155.1 MBOAT family protein [Leptospira ainlahdjerensis]